MKIKVSLSYITKLLNDLQFYKNEYECGWSTYQHNLKEITEDEVLEMYKDDCFDEVKNGKEAF